MKYISLFLALLVAAAQAQEYSNQEDSNEKYSSAEIKPHNGRPTVFINGQPTALPSYSPVSLRRKELAFKQTERFFPHQMGAYFITVPSVKFTDWAYFSDTPFWVGDTVSSTALAESEGTLDEQAAHILKGDPNACLIVRFGAHEPKSWRDLHPDQLFVNEDGKRLDVPSLASSLYNAKAAEYSRAIIEHCEKRTWAHRIIGYANFERTEGTHEPVIRGWMFDHSALMTSRWREYLKQKYGTVEKLRAAYNDGALTFENVEVPRDKLRWSTLDVSNLLYFQNAKENQPLRDYLLLQRELYGEHFRALAAGMQAAVRASGHKRFLVYDSFKQTMQGWANAAFFDANVNWPLAFPDDRAASGGVGMSTLWSANGFDGLITPHDYHARGAGGVYEPEGSVDSAILRGKYFLAEMDTRTYTGTDVNFPARSDKEFAAVTWRNLATSWTRGFNSYWMDVYQDWFASEEIHKTIERQTQVIKESVNWRHEDVPGIAVILDDEAMLETNGNGAVLNEQALWDLKLGLARCGVPYRIYLLDDLELENFPKHKLFYFPNLYRADDERIALLKQRVLRSGNVVVWGPGSGISDGEKISAQSATVLTGFDFHFLPVNYPRRTMISNFDHPITRGLKPDTVLQNGVAFGPCLYPKDGVEIGRAFAKGGRDWSGLAVKEMNGWKSIFSTTTDFPADLWRNIAKYTGTHVYSNTNDILLADSSIVALHSIQSGKKRIELPGEYSVYDVVTGRRVGIKLHAIQFHLNAPETRVFRLAPSR
jgi:hypothetical protein